MSQNMRGYSHMSVHEKGSFHHRESFGLARYSSAKDHHGRSRSFLKRSAVPSPGRPYNRLLEDLSLEFGRLSAQVVDLTREREQLRRENSELNELITVGVQQTKSLAKGMKGAVAENVSATTTSEAVYMTLSVGLLNRGFFQTKAGVHLALAQELTTGSPYSVAPSGGETPRRSYWSMVYDNEEELNGQPIQPAATIGQEEDEGSLFINNQVQPDQVRTSVGNGEHGSSIDLEGDTSTIYSNTEDDDDEEFTKERLRVLKEQFSRLDRTGCGVLTPQDCFAIVSQIENQKYGHVKHELKRVHKDIKSVQGNLRGFDAEVNTQVGLSFDNFCDIMRDNPPLDSRGNSLIVDDMSYLRRAFESESTEHLTLLARKNIAMRNRLASDPKPTGCLRHLLETLPPFIICMNALVIGLQNDIPSQAWDWLEKGFLCFYMLEFLLKMHLLGPKRYFCGNDGRWNCFDFACLLSGLIDVALDVYQRTVNSGSTDIWVSQILRVVRLVRLARIARSFRYKLFEDLKSMVSGVLSGARVLWWSIVLLFMIVYVVGVFMRDVIGENFGDHREFANLPSSMFSVFRCFTDGCTDYDGKPLQELLRRHLQERGYGGVFMIAYILMFLVVTVGVFNLIMAIFIDNVVSTTVKRKQQELGAHEEEMRTNLQEMLVKLVEASVDVHQSHMVRRPNGSFKSKDKKDELRERAQVAAEGMAWLRATEQVITRDLFNTWLTDQDMLSLLDDMEIDTATKFEIFDVCDVDKSGSLTPDELVSGLMRLRGPMSKCDIIAIRLKVRYLTDLLEDMHRHMAL